MSDVKEKLLKLDNGGRLFFNQHQGGGPYVVRVDNSFHLYEIPLYGGSPKFYSTYSIQHIDLLIREAESWT